MDNLTNLKMALDIWRDRCSCERTEADSTPSERLTDYHYELTRYAKGSIGTVDIPNSYKHLNEMEQKLANIDEWLTKNSENSKDPEHYRHVSKSLKGLRAKIENVRSSLEEEKLRRQERGISLTANARVGTVQERADYLRRRDALKEAGPVRYAVDRVCTSLGLPWGQVKC